MASWSSSHPTTVSPFKNLPYQVAGGFNRGFAAPLSKAFSLEGGSPAFQKKLASADTPFADWIRQTQAFLPTVMPQAQQLGSDIASRAPGLYNRIQSQVDQFLANLPGFQSWVSGGVNAVNQGLGLVNEGANATRESIDAARNAQPAASQLLRSAAGGVDYAKRAVDEAFNPLANSAAYRLASQRALPGITSAATSRGLGGGGAEAGAEQDFLTQLALEMQAREQGNQQAALGGYTNAINANTGAFAPTTTLADLIQRGGAQFGELGSRSGVLGGQLGELATAGSNLGQAGITAATAGQTALDQYAAQMAASYQIPFEQAQNILKFITATHNPRLALLQATAPQVAEVSKSHSVL